VTGVVIRPSEHGWSAYDGHGQLIASANAPGPLTDYVISDLRADPVTVTSQTDPRSRLKTLLTEAAQLAYEAELPDVERAADMALSAMERS
jgi:hypothetical protein